MGVKWGTGRVLSVEEEKEKNEKGGVNDHRRPETPGKEEGGIESLLGVCCTGQDWGVSAGEISPAGAACDW